MLVNHDCEQLIFLGDFLHALASHAPATLAALRAWRQCHGGLQCLLIHGNHDAKAGDPPHYLKIKVLSEPHVLGSFALQHLPVLHVAHHVIAGHLHPLFRLHGKGKQTLRLPCFQHGPGMTVLPAFGDFTGGYNVQAADGERIFVTDGSCVWPIR